MHGSTNRTKAVEGCILGALAGDAAGALLEFLGHDPTDDDVHRALAMTGRGHWNTAPGQITDDGELALCLMHAIADRDEFDIERVAVQYLRWLDSHPFDIGNTMSTQDRNVPWLAK